MGSELQRRSVPDIIEELAKRDGVEKIIVPPDSLFDIHVIPKNEDTVYGYDYEGSAVILVIQTD